MSLEMNVSSTVDLSTPVDQYNPESVVIMTLFVATFLVGVPGNILVIWVTSVKMKRTVNTVWFCNLAVADLTCCLSLPFSFTHVILHDHWPYGSFLCKVIPSIIILNMFASVFTLVAISVDRCILVVKPVWAQNHRSVGLAWLLCLVTWLMAFLMCLPAVLHRETFTHNNVTYCTSEYGEKDHDNSIYYLGNGYEDQDYDNSGSHEDHNISKRISTSYEFVSNSDKSRDFLGEFPMSNQLEETPESLDFIDFPVQTEKYPLYFDNSEYDLWTDVPVHESLIVITFTRSIFGFFLPLLIIFVCYVRLTWKVQGARFSTMGNKTRKVVIGIVLAFCVCWIPYHAIGICMLYVDNPVLRSLDHLSQGLAYSNSCLNPILYVFMGKEFKHKMRQSLRGLLESAFSEELTQTTNRSRSKDSNHSTIL
ncbi:C3a anaphylatoxin chemotactic receptor [Rhinophrynus dorsalis]